MTHASNFIAKGISVSKITNFKLKRQTFSYILKHTHKWKSFPSSKFTKFDPKNQRFRIFHISLHACARTQTSKFTAKIVSLSPSKITTFSQNDQTYIIYSQNNSKPTQQYQSNYQLTHIRSALIFQQKNTKYP